MYELTLHLQSLKEKRRTNDSTRVVPRHPHPPPCIIAFKSPHLFFLRLTNIKINALKLPHSLLSEITPPYPILPIL